MPAHRLLAVTLLVVVLGVSAAVGAGVVTTTTTTDRAAGTAAAGLSPLPLSHPWFGFNDTSVLAGQSSPGRSAALARLLGATSARITIDWAWIQPKPAPPDFSTYDSIYRADVAAGIRPLFVLTGAPRWTWPRGAHCPATTTCNYPPSTAHDAAWRAIAAAVARRYPAAAGIEIWNEPNATWAWAGGINPRRYTQLLVLADRAIRAVHRSLPVIGGALAADLSDTPSGSGMPLPLFLRAMYRDGARGHMDGLSIHPYPNAIDPWYADKAISTTTEIENAGGDHVPLWITETGLSTDGFSPAQQATVDAELVRELRTFPGIAGIYLSTLVEPASGGQGYGLLTPALHATPAFCLLARLAATGYECPASVGAVLANPAQDARWRAETLLQQAVAAALAYHARRHTYAGLNSADLAALDPRLSAAAPARLSIGPLADPARIAVYSLSPDRLLLCNASRAGASFCVYRPGFGDWVYGHAAGPISAAAQATLGGHSESW